MRINQRKTVIDCKRCPRAGNYIAFLIKKVYTMGRQRRVKNEFRSRALRRGIERKRQLRVADHL